MTRRVARPTSALVMILTLLASSGGPGPAAQQQTAPPASPSTEAALQAEGPPYVLSLDDSLRTALENNLDLIVRSYDPLRAETQVILAESAFDPTLTGTATSTQTERPSLTSFISSSKTKELNIAFDDPTLLGGAYRIEADALDIDLLGTEESDLFWRFSVVQPLLRNFGPKANKAFIVRARNTLGISQWAFRQTVMDTLAATESAYWDLNFANMNLSTSRAALKLAQDFLEQNRIKVRVGTLAPIEITQAEAQVADRDEAVIITENQVRTAEDALRRVMSVPRDSAVWSQRIEPSDPLPLMELTPDMQTSVDVALRNRPDLEQARLDLKNKENDLALRRNLKRWNLNLAGEYGKLGVSADAPEFTCSIVEPDTGFCLEAAPTGVVSRGSFGDSLDSIRAGDNQDWRVSLLLGIPLGNRQANANFTDAEYALGQSRRNLEALELNARVQVRQAVREVETALKRVKAAQVNVRLQQEKLSAEQKKFENGMSTSFQVLQFQTDLFVAQGRQNLAMADYNKAIVELERAQGTLLDTRRVDVEPDKAATRPVPYRPRTRVRDAPGGESQPEGTGPSIVPDRGDATDEGEGNGGQPESGRSASTLPNRFEFVGRRLVARGGVMAAASLMAGPPGATSPETAPSSPASPAPASGSAPADTGGSGRGGAAAP